MHLQTKYEYIYVVQYLRVPQRGQHSPSGTVAFAHGIRGHEILRHNVAEFCTQFKIICYIPTTSAFGMRINFLMSA